MTEEGDREVGAEEALKTEENVRVAEVERKMDDLKSDVQRISEELKNVVSELKKSIVDVRSAVSEIENPFNLLRVISSEKDLNKLSGERFGGQVKTIALPEEEKEALERLEAEREERPEEEKEAVEVAPERLEAEREERPNGFRLSRLGLVATGKESKLCRHRGTCEKLRVYGLLTSRINQIYKFPRRGSREG